MSGTRTTPPTWRWEFFCGHVSIGGNEFADACPVCGERELVRKSPLESRSLDESA